MSDDDERSGRRPRPRAPVHGSRGRQSPIREQSPTPGTFDRPQRYRCHRPCARIGSKENQIVCVFEESAHAEARGQRARHPDRPGHPPRQADAGVLATGGTGLGDADRTAGQSGPADERGPGPVQAGRRRLGPGRPVLRAPRVDLSFGRHEEGGLRCLYHGWLYGADGRCLEQPAEPEQSNFAAKVRIPSYPCEERNGIVFGYLGAGDPPPFPDYDCFTAPEEYTFAFKGLWECNWLQGVEGGIDPSHVSFLHRFVGEDPRDVYGQQFSEEVAGTGVKLSKLVGDSFRPDIEVEVADHGLRVYALRQLTDEIRHVRITNLMFPNAFVVPFGNSKVFVQWHVPIDDENHYWFMILYDFHQPTDQQTLLDQRLKEFPCRTTVRCETNQTTGVLTPPSNAT